METGSPLSSALHGSPRFVWLNETSPDESSSTSVVGGSGGGGFPCQTWLSPQPTVFQMANVLFCLSYMAPNGRFGVLFMHGLLIIAFLMFSTWAWNVKCVRFIFSWNFCMMLINMGQTLYVLYTMRSVKFPQELEEIYTALFQPLQVSRLLFKKMVSIEYAQMITMHAGEAYAMQNLTKTDRLGMLVHGKVNVMTDHHFLHHIFPMQFLDSPEFESCKPGVDDKFKVSIIAATNCRYLFWQRENLEYLLIKEPFLASVLGLVIARDITNKLYSMNEKIVTEQGSHLDIRLPSITGSSVASQQQGHQQGQGSSGGDVDWSASPYQQVPRTLRSKSLQCNNAAALLPLQQALLQLQLRHSNGGCVQGTAGAANNAPGGLDKDNSLLGSREELMGSSRKGISKSREALDLIGSFLMTIVQSEDDLD